VRFIEDLGLQMADGRFQLKKLHEEKEVSRRDAKECTQRPKRRENTKHAIGISVLWSYQNCFSSDLSWSSLRTLREFSLRLCENLFSACTLTAIAPGLQIPKLKKLVDFESGS
jgi:hypothetical protein